MSNATTTLGDIVTETPAAARILERLSLDYCCGGQRTLGEACATAGIDPDDVLAEVASLGEEAGSEWTEMSPGELVDHLEAVHHSYLKSELPRLSELMAKVDGVHGDRHPELREVREVYEALRADLGPHLMKEEQILFPMIRQLEAADSTVEFHCGTLRNPISVMSLEHDLAGDLFARLSVLTDHYKAPADACGSYTALYAGLAEVEADTHLHIHKENNVLFPAVFAMEAEAGAT